MEEDLKDNAKAQELYNQVLTKYPGSIYVAEARKRFRKLRGDNS
jgi:outer membrane protein assembly factor BamD (BamD/ComL family)